MHKRLSIALLVAALTSIAVPAASAQTFYWSDNSNDAPAGAPDLTTASAAIDTNGLITWTIVTQKLGAFDSETAVDVRINTDASMTTGFGGTDYLIRTAAGLVGFYRWNGGTFELTSAPGLSANLGFPMTVTVQSSAIGSPSTVWFKLRDWGKAPYYENCCGDEAPASPYWWTFDTSTPNAAPSAAPSAAPTPATTPNAAPAPATTPTPTPTATPTASTAPPASPFSPDFGAPHIDAQQKSNDSLPEADPVKRAPAVRAARITRRGASVTIKARFKRSVAKAEVRCIVTRGHKRLLTAIGHASGSTATCQTTAGHVSEKTTATMVLRIGGTTTRIALAVPADAPSAAK
jgi:hypothetical protein